MYVAHFGSEKSESKNNTFDKVKVKQVKTNTFDKVKVTQTNENM